MKRNFMIQLAAGLGILAAGFGVCGAAQGLTKTAISEEMPLAGITVSLDKYCDMLLADAKEEQTQTGETKAEQIVAGGVSQNTSIGTKTSAKKKKTSPKINLNLKYRKLGIAKVDTYLNVRKNANESSKIVGKMTKNAGCDILSLKKGWAKIVSGQVKGYVKAKYLIQGTKAEQKAQKVATLQAVVKTQTLNVRYLPSTKARIYDQLSEEEDYTIEKKDLTKEYMKSYIKKHCSKKDLKGISRESMYDDLKNWVMLSVDDEKMFVSKDFISMGYKLSKAVTVKEDQKSSSGKNASSKGTSLVKYAMQFLGNRYVWGGTSLTKGTDCSGFTMRIYEHFGYSIPRTSAAQAAATRSVSRSDVRVGDLFFYGSGRVSHVAMYIGNGQIIHASNARDGIKISSAYYRQPLKIGRVM